MTSKKNPSIKLRKLSIKNYKGIDSLTMEFPEPIRPDDPDILVMGSENGLGTTSVLECCAILLMCVAIPKKSFKMRDRQNSVHIPDLLIRAGTNAAEIAGSIVIEDTPIELGVQVDRDGNVEFSGKFNKLESLTETYIDSDEVPELVKAIFGISPNPVIEDTFLWFHSYRKTQEGNPDMRKMARDPRADRKWYSLRSLEIPESDFKLLILRLLMSNANLFEFYEEEGSEEAIDKLNELLELYAGGTINKLRLATETNIELRIKLMNSDESIAFDGLSSGQKEIISTLFLIWYHSRNNPIVVFIDEPGLHLNSQWHRPFVNFLLDIAPHNQYVMATHSETIMDSAGKDRRFLLADEKKGMQ